MHKGETVLMQDGYGKWWHVTCTRYNFMGRDRRFEVLVRADDRSAAEDLVREMHRGVKGFYLARVMPTGIETLVFRNPPPPEPGDFEGSIFLGSGRW